ncbi:hypothetical protein [Daejeonella sp.]|uniref:hypothetical protein n=1 Tax=Daejeonella sp. TaxID=2805397 RepID=UPI0030BE5992
MIKRVVTVSILLLSLITTSFHISCTSARQGVMSTESDVSIGKLSTGAGVSLKKGSNNQWGIYINDAGLSSLSQPNPVAFEIYKDSLNIADKSVGYESIEKENNGFTGRALLQAGDVFFEVADKWEIVDELLRLSRKVKVGGNSTGGFLSSIKFINQQKQKRGDVNYFAPGMIYGSTGHITKAAIGGSEAGLQTWIREDRLPAPMFGVHYKDGRSVTILNPKPEGNTTREDSHDREAKTLIDGRFKFGAIGAEEQDGNIVLGFVWPGTEGETTYRGYEYPGGQLHKWRRRYHPVKDGFTQDYEVDFRFHEADKKFKDYYRNAWRWAWNTLNPQVNKQDIGLARRILIDMLGERVETVNGITGIRNSTMATVKQASASDKKTVMGFTGKTIESANFLLQDADRDKAPNREKHRQQALNIINTYLKLNLSPPEGEGFYFDSGGPALAIPRMERVFLRSFGDDLKALLKAVKREKAQGREHADWLAWVQSFADWLLPQQTAEGGFPRAWEPVTGKVADTSPKSGYNAIPFLLLLTELTGDPKYKEAAVRAGEFCWKDGQYMGIFVGGTIDNPDVVDKEAGTLSLEAHLALYEATQDKKWLERAKTAADFSETWIYIWNVPMPEDESNEALHWKKGVSTVGLQLISTGHSLVDAYMAFDVDEYARLSVRADDKHYLDVARILLHNTKGMLALPNV